MNDLFCRLQENKQLKRQLLLLHYLKKKKSPSSTRSLAEITKTSLPTVRSDIEALIYLLPKEATIIYTKKRGYQLMLSCSCNVETIILEIAKRTPVFQMIDQYFRGQTHTLRSAAAHLYSSESRVRKIIRQMNKVLTLYHLHWHTATMTLQGNEADIRCFLFDFYQSFKIDFLSEPFCVDPTVTDSFQLLTGLSLHPSKAHLWMIILQKRLLHKKGIILDPKLKKEVVSRQSFINFKKRLLHRSTVAVDSSHFPKNEVIWLYIVFLASVTYITEENQVCYPEDKRHYSAYEQLFSPMNLPKENTHLLYAFSINLQLLSRISVHFQKCLFTKRLDVPVHLKNLYEDWYTYLKTPTVNQAFPIEHPEHVALTFSFFHYALFDGMPPSVQVLFSFQGCAGLPSYLIKITKQILPRFVQPIFTVRPATSKIKEPYPSNLSLIVCNHELMERSYNCPVFTFSAFPQEKEWLALHQLFLEMERFN